jgi:hypothetical protein
MTTPCHGLPVRVGMPSWLRRAAMRSKPRPSFLSLHALQGRLFAFVVPEGLAALATAFAGPASLHGHRPLQHQHALVVLREHVHPRAAMREFGGRPL